MATGNRFGNDIRSILSSAAADGVDERRSVRAASPREALEFVLQKVSATVMGRVLTFDFGDAGSLRVEAASRRVTRLVLPLPDSCGVETGRLEADPANLSDPEICAAFAALLTGLCATADQVRLTVAPIVGGADPVRRGVSVEALADALGMAAEESAGAEADGLARFVAGAAEAILCAEKVTNDRVEPLKGSAEDLECLTRRVKDLLPDMSPQDGRIARMIGPRGLLVLGQGTGSAPHLVVGAFDGVYLVALAKGGKATGLPALWRSTLAG
ncbi:MAG: hypothetical protein ACWA5A_05800 [Marinibacterium sp.]